MRDTKERILTAALTLFAADGYEAASVSRIAGELGMTKSALYKHYADKRDIFDSILRRMEQLDAEQAQRFHLPEGTPEEMTEAYRRTSLGEIASFSKAQFSRWTQDGFSALFRRMLTLEQYRSEEMSALYQQYLAAGPLGYMTDLFRVFTDTESDAARRAMAFYAPICFSYNLYDGAADKKAVTDAVFEHIDRFIGAPESGADQK